MPNTKICQCESCGKLFSKLVGEYNRKIKLKTPFYCSKKCSSKETIKKCKSIKKWTHSIKNKQHIKKYSNNKIDEYTPFRNLLRRTKYRFKTNNLTLSYIKSIWDSQNGKCAILGHKLELPNDKKKINHNILASIDRVNNNLGYIQGNIRIVCASINYAKNKFDDKYLLEFIELCKKTSSVEFK